jgi:HEAT repeat protein
MADTTEATTQVESRKLRRKRGSTNHGAETTVSPALPPEHAAAENGVDAPAAPTPARSSRPIEPLNDACQALVDQLLEGESDRVRRAALAQLSALPDAEKEQVGHFLARRLADEDNEWQRAWCVSALGALHLPLFANLLAKRLKADDFEWVRYWAALALTELQAPDVREHLIAALKDESDLVRAVALRLLIENGYENYIDRLQAMMEDNQNWLSRWAACKVLRRDAGHKSLRERVESKFIPVLADRLLDRHEFMDVRYQAAMALGSMEQSWLEAIRALSRSLEENLPDWIRRTCVEALAEINKPETRNALLLALRDRDAEIRVRAANALNKTLGAAGAVGLIIDHLLQQDQPLPEYVDALRHIDHAAAATALSIPHPDPKMADRAARALTMLGGEAALRTLQAQRTQVVETYTKLLGDADDKIMALFDNLMQRAQFAFTMTMWMHGVIFGLGVLILLLSLWIAVQGSMTGLERLIGVGGATGSLATLLLLFYRSPLHQINQSVTNLTKVNVIFLGYMRQINQIDATFKQLFLASGAFNIPQMKETVAEIEVSVRKTLEKVKVYFPDNLPTNPSPEEEQ